MGTSGVEQGTDWLQALSNTQRAYRKEAERFLTTVHNNRNSLNSQFAKPPHTQNF